MEKTELNLSTARRRVAIVEDDPFWQYQLRHNLKAIDADLEICVLGSAEEFLNGAERNFDLVISDQNLGLGGSGLSLWRSLRTSHPTIPFALTSGTADTVFDELTVEGLVVRPVFIEKPYRFQTFKKQIEAMLASRAIRLKATEANREFDWNKAFGGVMAVSAVASLIAVGLHLELFQEASTAPQVQPLLETIQASIHDHRHAYVNSETQRRMMEILGRAEQINKFRR